MQKIIITADDYGMCDIVNDAIDSGIQNGFITTTNVMVNMEALEAAAKLRERFPNISIGMHWNVTTGKPVTDPNEIPTLVDKNGNFFSITEFKRRYAKGQIQKKDLEIELCNQYDMFRNVCGEADYWNTHENSSLSTKTFPVFAEVAQKYNIKATRTFQRVYYDKINLSLKQATREFLVKNFFELWFTYIRKYFKMPTARVVSFDRISKTRGGVLLEALKKDGRDYIEVVFHPATSANHPCFGNISTERVKEYEYTSSKDVLNQYKDNDFVFCNFGDLK